MICPAEPGSVGVARGAASMLYQVFNCYIIHGHIEVISLCICIGLGVPVELSRIGWVARHGIQIKITGFMKQEYFLLPR